MQATSIFKSFAIPYSSKYYYAQVDCILILGISHGDNRYKGKWCRDWSPIVWNTVSWWMADRINIINTGVDRLYTIYLNDVFCLTRWTPQRSLVLDLLETLHVGHRCPAMPELIHAFKLKNIVNCRSEVPNQLYIFLYFLLWKQCFLFWYYCFSGSYKIFPFLARKR